MCVGLRLYLSLSLIHTFSRSLLRCCVSPVRSTCWDRVARSLQNSGFWIRSSSVISHNGNADKTGAQMMRERLININLRIIMIIKIMHSIWMKKRNPFSKQKVETKKF